MTSTTLDVGGGCLLRQGISAAWSGANLGVDYLPADIAPVLGGRVGFGGMALRVHWIPEDGAWVMGLDLGVQGVIAVF